MTFLRRHHQHDHVGGEVATGFIEVMKSQPLALALVVMNIALLALFYVIVQSAEARHKLSSEQLIRIRIICT